ncbi:MAG: DUF294 nucleotidyltransferase-like domain-containing protein, partial [Acidobacteriota bacterium]
LEIAWAGLGERLVERNVANDSVYVLRKGAVRLELDGQRVAELGRGEVFGIGAVTGKPSRFDVVTVAESLLYRLDGGAVRRLMATEPAFAAFFVEQLSERLRALAEGGPMAFSGDFVAPVEELCAGPPVTVELGARSADAARRMRAARVSSVLVIGPGGELAGIVTDRDLRARVLAEDRGPETPVREIMSSPVATVDAGVTGSEALLELLRRGVHHLPVVRDDEIIGVVTPTDLQPSRRRCPQSLYKRIEVADRAADLATYADDVADMVQHLHASRLAATDVGRVVAALGDTLAVRLLTLAEADLGPPPCAYAWIVFGSEGRREQSLLTDQDNALVYADATEEAADYFRALAGRVVDDLQAVGIPPCAGGFMATNWCRPLAEWRRLFRKWIDEPEPEALLEAANFFDFRSLAGGLDTGPLEETIATAAHHRLFLAQMAKTCLDLRPPLGLLPASLRPE